MRVNMRKHTVASRIIDRAVRDNSSKALQGVAWHSRSTTIQVHIEAELQARDDAATWYRRQKAMQRHPSNIHARLRVVLTGV